MIRIYAFLSAVMHFEFRAPRRAPQGVTRGFFTRRNINLLWIRETRGDLCGDGFGEIRNSSNEHSYPASSNITIWIRF